MSSKTIRQELTGVPAGPTGAITLTFHDSEPGALHGSTSDESADRQLELFARASGISVDVSEIQWEADEDRGYAFHAVAEGIRTYGAASEIGWGEFSNESGQVLALFESTASTRQVQQDVVEGGLPLISIVTDDSGEIDIPEVEEVDFLSLEAQVELMPRVAVRFADTGVDKAAQDPAKVVFNRAASCFMDGLWLSPRLWVKRLTSTERSDIEELVFSAVGRAVNNMIFQD